MIPDKIKSSLFLLLASGIGVSGMHAKDLSVVEVIGNKYYVYEVKKGDSIYGIAKSNGWDVTELERLNPNTVRNLKKGDRLYYPLEKGKPISADAVPESVSAEYIEPIAHIVKRGETVYSISRMYGIPVEKIYAAHPSARHGIKEGEKLELSQPASNGDGTQHFVYYEIKSGDTLYALAQRFNTTVESLMRANPGVSERNFQEGKKIRILIGKDTRKRVTKQFEQVNVASIDNYKVEKDDTWDTISQKTGVSKEDLLKSNGEWHKLKKDDLVVVPRTDTVTYEKEIIFEDPREQTSEGLSNIYNEANKIEQNFRERRNIDISYVMMDPSSHKDIEFAKGVLTGIDSFRDKGYKIRFKILDGTQNSVSVIDSLSSVKTDIIFSTSDKGIPSYLAEYAEVSQTPLVNVFDVKNTLYSTNPYVVQYLTPSDVLNRKAADYIAKCYNGYKVIYVGNDTSDEENNIAAFMKADMADSPALDLTLEEFGDYPFSDGEKYLIYGNVSSRNDISRLLDTVSKGLKDAPMANVIVVGRPNWVVYEESLLGDKLACDVMLPARFYFNKDDIDTKKFISHFKSLFERGPMKSYPLYAGVGYDMVTYFIPMIATTGGDLNEAGLSNGTVVNDISLVKLSNWSGFYNSNAYIIRYSPDLPVDVTKL